MLRWLPDDKQIALMGALPGKSWRIYLISCDGGTPRQITHGESGALGDFDASWSPDGSPLAFGAFPHWRDASRKVVIRVLDLKRHQISQLPGSEGLWSPRWSRNGSYIAALFGNSEMLMVYDLRTHNQTELATGRIGDPSWSRDSEFVYFDAMGSDPAFFRVPFATSES